MNKNTINRREILRNLGFGSCAAVGGFEIARSKSKLLARQMRTGMQASKKRIMVGSFSHETNTFNPRKTTLEIVKQNALFGSDVLKRGGEMVHGTIGDCIGGFIDVLEMFDIDLVGSFRSGADQGIVTAEAFDYVAEALLDTLEKHEVDAVYLHLHGAGVSENHHDLEGSLLEMIRKKVGPDIPILFTFDLHCTLTNKIIENADAGSIYRTYPHIDAFECGQEIAGILLGIMMGRIKPVMAISKLPLMIGPPLNVVTSEMPMKLIYDRAKEMQRTIPGVLTACPAHGFMQQDCPDQGAGVLVTTDGDRDLAQKLADELGDMMFSYRKEFWIDLPDPAETIRLAMKSDKPVAISDGGDNMGAGTPGDGTALLHEILKQGVDSALVQVWDPQSAETAAKKGVGATVTLDIGGKSGPIYGPPATVTGRVTAISGPEKGKKPAVRIDFGGITILVNSYQIGPNDQSNLRAIGIDPEKYRMIVCKGGFAFRPQYPASIYNYILSNTPGYSSVDLKTFNYTKIRRPIYPLDDI